MSNIIKEPKPVDQLTFTDDGMFQTVMRDPKICSELVERLLDVKINHVDYPELEKEIAPYYTSKSIRLDVYLKDSNKIIDIEMQSYSQEAIGKRTRYYQSMIDIDSLMKGDDYSDLKESYILFICKQDPFKKDDKKNFGLPCYTFKNACVENNSVNLNDKSLKVIYNASAYESEKNEKIRAFLHYIYTNEPGEDDFSKRLSAIVNQTKMNEKFRREYAAMNLHDRDLIRAAKKEAIEQKAIEDALNFLKEDVPAETIAKCVNLPLEEVLKLKEKIA